MSNLCKLALRNKSDLAGPQCPHPSGPYAQGRVLAHCGGPIMRTAAAAPSPGARARMSRTRRGLKMRALALWPYHDAAPALAGWRHCHRAACWQLACSSVLVACRIPTVPLPVAVPPAATVTENPTWLVPSDMTGLPPIPAPWPSTSGACNQPSLPPRDHPTGDCQCPLPLCALCRPRKKKRT